MSKVWQLLLVLILVMAISGGVSARHQQHHGLNVGPSDIKLPDSDNIIQKYGPIIPGHNPEELLDIIKVGAPALDSHEEFLKII